MKDHLRAGMRKIGFKQEPSSKTIQQHFNRAPVSSPRCCHCCCPPFQLKKPQWQPRNKENPRGWEEVAVFCLSGQKRILAHDMKKVCQKYQEIPAIIKSDVSQRSCLKTAFQVKPSIFILRNITWIVFFYVTFRWYMWCRKKKFLMIKN